MSHASTATTASPSSASIVPIPPNVRYELIDIVRGFALFGVMLANMSWTTQWFALTAAQRAALPTADVDRIVQPVIMLLTDYKFYTLFSMLFGVGFAMQLSRAAERGGDVIRVYSRRLGILFCLGVGHALLLWFGDILHTYALVGFVLILFRNRSDRVLISWAFVLAALIALLPLLHSITTTDSVPEAGASGTKAAKLSRS